jgi:hypothetical protein
VGVPTSLPAPALEPGPLDDTEIEPEGGVVCATFIVVEMLLVALDELVAAVALGAGPAVAARLMAWVVPPMVWP